MAVILCRLGFYFIAFYFVLMGGRMLILQIDCFWPISELVLPVYDPDQAWDKFSMCLGWEGGIERA